MRIGKLSRQFLALAEANNKQIGVGCGELGLADGDLHRGASL